MVARAARHFAVAASDLVNTLDLNLVVLAGAGFDGVGDVFLQAAQDADRRDRRSCARCIRSRCGSHPSDPRPPPSVRRRLSCIATSRLTAPPWSRETRVTARELSSLTIALFGRWTLGSLSTQPMDVATCLVHNLDERGRRCGFHDFGERRWLSQPGRSWPHWALTACGGQWRQSGGSSDGGSATSGTVNWWSWTPDNDLAAREIAEFNKQYPDIKVTYKKVPIDNYAAVLKPGARVQRRPGRLHRQRQRRFSAEAFASYAYDLTPDMEKLLGADWKSKVYDGGVKAFTVKDRLVAAEWAKVGAGIMWINKDIFDKYGLKPPTTLAEWQSVCKTFRSKGLGCFREGMAGTSGFVVDTVHSIADSTQPGLWAAALPAPRNGPTRAWCSRWRPCARCPRTASSTRVRSASSSTRT